MLGSGKIRLKTWGHGLLLSVVCTRVWAYVRSFDFAYVGLISCTWTTNQKTLTDLLRYKSSHLSPKPSPMYFQPREHIFWGLPMVENSPLDVSTWIKKLGPNFKDSVAPYGLSCILPYHQITVDEFLLHAASNYWILLSMYSTSME